MSVIDVTRHHSLDHDHAIAAADSLAQSLAKDFDVHYQWQGDEMTFKRSGVKGQLKVTSSTIAIHLELGFLLRPFKARIEREIHQHLDSLVEGGG
ncbi:polyhydroxyalkanoic acid system family protein [Marinobacteraceae bacterium S3BR75-40.1]